MNLRKIISEEIETIIEDFTFDNSNSGYRPPQEVVNTAQKALAVVKKNNLTKNGDNEGSGELKAVDLIQGKPFNHSMLKRMKAFFDKNKQLVVVAKSKGETLENSGLLQTWNLWGGDAGMNWVNREISSDNDNNMSSKKVRRDSGMEKTSTLMDPTNTRNTYKI